MRHNFPAVEALEAGGISLQAMVAVAPSVDPEHLLIREARPWFERLALRTSAAIALPYVVYVRADAYRRRRDELTDLVVHELIHVHQWRDEGYIRFAVIYVADYLRGRLRGDSHRDAYRAIRYEVEARRLTEVVRSG
ncbi:MAG: hypothetical protein KJO87_08595 [Acidimicrobiia bacterium]|nr:hypothetical protein [Acidimicrobiia bacterium]